MSCDEQSIFVPKSLREAIRLRPKMYLGRELNLEALHYIITELIEDTLSVECANSATQVNVRFEEDNWIVISDNGRGLPVDTDLGWIYKAYGSPLSAERFEQIMDETDHGKRIPPEFQANPKVKVQPIIEVTFTRLYTGEATPERYDYHGFAFYMGAILNALSTELYVQTNREGSLYEMLFRQGELVKPLSLIEKSAAKGTLLRFQPELSGFSTTDIDSDRLAKRILSVTKKYESKTVNIIRQASS